MEIIKLAYWFDYMSNDNKIHMSIDAVKIQNTTLKMHNGKFKIIDSISFNNEVLLRCEYSDKNKKNIFKTLFFIYDINTGIFSKLVSNNGESLDSAKEKMSESLFHNSQKVFSSLLGSSLIKKNKSLLIDIDFNNRLAPFYYNGVIDTKILSKYMNSINNAPTKHTFIDKVNKLK